MTLCCQVTNYPINAQESKCTLPTQGHIILLAQWGTHGAYPCRQGVRSPRGQLLVRVSIAPYFVD